MRFRISLLAGALVLSGCSATMSGSQVSLGEPPANSVVTVTPPEHDPSELQVLFWTDEKRAERFRSMEAWFAGHEVPPAAQPRVFAKGEPLSKDEAAEIRKFMEVSNAAGVMVLQDGKKRYEAYRLGFDPQQRWTSFSVAKSFTSTLLGAALNDGFIASLQDPVTKYIPDLAGSAYDGVTVEQLATMTSGVAWNEDYTDPKSDVAQMNRFVLEHGSQAIMAQMRGLKREAPAGEKYVYKTGETNLIGVLVENAVGLPLAKYAKSKIVEPAGFEGGMFWMSDPRGGNIGGCCLSLRLGDYARMGQFVLEGGARLGAGRLVCQSGRVSRQFWAAGNACAFWNGRPRLWLWLSMVDLSRRQIRRAGHIRASDHAGTREEIGRCGGEQLADRLQQQEPHRLAGLD